MDGYCGICTFPETVNSLWQLLSKTLPKNRSCRSNTGFPTFTRAKKSPGTNWIWYQRTQAAVITFICKARTYLSPLFCRMHPSIISFTSGIATLSKLAGLTPWNTQITTEKLGPKLDSSFDCADKPPVLTLWITDLNNQCKLRQSLTPVLQTAGLFVTFASVPHIPLPIYSSISVTEPLALGAQVMRAELFSFHGSCAGLREQTGLRMEGNGSSVTLMQETTD